MSELGGFIMQGLFNGLIDPILDIIIGVRSKIIGAFENIHEFLGKKVPEIVSNVLDSFGSLPKNIYEITKNLISGFVKGIEDFSRGINEKIKVVTDNVIGWFKEKLGIHSISTVFII